MAEIFRRGRSRRTASRAASHRRSFPVNKAGFRARRSGRATAAGYATGRIHPLKDWTLKLQGSHGSGARFPPRLHFQNTLLQLFEHIFSFLLCGAVAKLFHQAVNFRRRRAPVSRIAAYWLGDFAA